MKSYIISKEQDIEKGDNTMDSEDRLPQYSIRVITEKISVTDSVCRNTDDSRELKESTVMMNRNNISTAGHSLSKKSRDVCRTLRLKGKNFNTDYRKTDEVLMKMTEKTAHVLDALN